jgi:hypothetical protein
MRFVPLAVLFCSVAPAPGQTSPEAQKKHEFRFQPPLTIPGKPQFKLEIPKQGERFPLVPAPKVEIQPQPRIDYDVDPGMLRKPQGFAPRPARPEPRRNLYPNLKIQPTLIGLACSISSVF